MPEQDKLTPEERQFVKAIEFHLPLEARSALLQQIRNKQAPINEATLSEMDFATLDNLYLLIQSALDEDIKKVADATSFQARLDELATTIVHFYDEDNDEEHDENDFSAAVEELNKSLALLWELQPAPAVGRTFKP